MIHAEDNCKEVV